MKAAKRTSTTARLKRYQELEGWLYVLPSLLLSVSLVLVPVVLTFLLGFTSWSGLGLPKWAGVSNFQQLFASSTFWEAFFNNIKWTAIFLTVPMFLGLLVSAALLRVVRLRYLQTLFLIPYILPTVIQSLVWQGMIYNPQSGLFGWLTNHGLSVTDPLITTGGSLYGIAIVNIWAWWGFLTVVFFASMRQVDVELIDAARVEGANFWQEFRYVLVPQVRPTLMFMMVMTVVWSFLVFDYVFILTGGGPADSSQVLATLAYQYGFNEFRFGKAASVSVFTGVIGVGIIGLYLWMQKRGFEI